LVKVPDVVRLHDVPATGLAAFEQVVNRGDRRADTARGLHAVARTVDLAKAAAFRMWLETELFDQCADLQRGCRRRGYLRAAQSQVLGGARSRATAAFSSGVISSIVRSDRSSREMIARA